MKSFIIGIDILIFLLLTGCAYHTAFPTTEITVIQKSVHPIADDATTEKIKTAFIKANLFGPRSVSAMGLSIVTINKVVYLNGTANSQTDIDRAIKIASSIIGVKRVESRVIVAY